MPLRDIRVEALEGRTLLAVLIPTQLVLGPSVDLTLEASTAAPDGSLIVAGNFGTAVDFDPRGSTLNVPVIGQRSWFVAKYTRAGAPVWVKTVGVADQNQTMIHIQAITTDAVGNVILGGTLNGPFDFDPSTKTHILSPRAGATHELTNDTFIWKLSNKGAFVFAKVSSHISTGTEQVYAVTVDRYGNPYESGTARPIDPDNGAPMGDAIPFVAKYSPTGQFAWSTPQQANAMMIGADDGAWLVSSGDAMGVTHLTALGRYKKYFRAAVAKTAGPGQFPQINAGSIDTDAAGNFVIAGSFSYTFNFAPNGTSLFLGPKTDNAFEDIFIAKYTPTGQSVFAFNIGSPVDDDHAFAARVEKISGDIYVAGDFSGQVDFDPSSKRQTILDAGNPLLYPHADAFAARYSGSGRFLKVASVHVNRNDRVRGFALNPGPLPFVAYDIFDPDSEFTRVYLYQPNLLR